MKITFCGAAKIVTGSCYLIEFKGIKFLVDCGMFQGRKETTRRNYLPFPFDPKEISYVFLTHAHIDHSGLIPKLVNQGFNGKIYSTSATADLTMALLEDSGHIHEMEVEHENRRRGRQGLPPRKPLYTKQQAVNCKYLFKRLTYDSLSTITKGLQVRYRDAGHILGSAIIEMYLNENGREKKIVFSGDLGQWDVPIVKNPTMIEEADYVLVESTYGDRLHSNPKERNKKLLRYCKETYARGGIVMIPVFAVERTQEILFEISKLIKKNKFPEMKVFLDSPLAIRVTNIFRRHRECFEKKIISNYKRPFKFKNLIYTKRATDSMRLNHIQEPCVILAGSGMCTAGRIRHHFKNHIWKSKNTVIFVGYQADHTLGRFIIEGAKKIKMMGIEVVVKAAIERINSFSAHSDKDELVKWMKGFKAKPKKVFIVHGEPKSQKALKDNLSSIGFKCTIPNIGDSFVL